MNGKRAPLCVPRLGRGLIVCLVLLTAGCGSRGTVSGTVTYKGAPIPSGNVTFVPEKGGAVTAVIEDGKYTAENVPAGPATIAVTSVAGNARSAFMSKRMTPPKDAPIPPEARKAFEGGQGKKGIEIPERYNDPNQSGLTCTVRGGPQTHDIDLK
jgi:hypothetical protein